MISVDFLLNQEEIAEQLCENKDKPELNCEGRCVLKKRMQRVLDNMEAEAVPESININNFMFYFFEADELSIDLPSPQLDCNHCYSSLDLLEAHVHTHTPPPRFA